MTRKYIKSKKYDYVFKYQTSKGETKYCYRYKYSMFGKRKEKQESNFKSEREAYKALLVTQQNILEEDYSLVVTSNLTVAQWYQKWLTMNKSTWAENTYISRESMFRDYVNDRIGHIKLSKLSLFQYQELFINDILEKQLLSPSTLDLYHKYMKTCFNAAVKFEIIPKNKINNAIIPKFMRKTDNYLTDKQLKIVLDDIYKNETISNYMFILGLTYTGCRIGELQGLAWKNVDFDNNIIKIVVTRKHQKLSCTKTKKARHIYVDEKYMKMLKRFRTWCIEQMFQHKRQLRDDDLVFISEQKAQPIANSTVASCLNRVYKRTNIKITAHGFRHTHATLLLKENKPITTIAKRLGNTPEVLMNTYSHIFDEMELELVEAFNENVDLSEEMSEVFKLSR